MLHFKLVFDIEKIYEVLEGTTHILDIALHTDIE